VDENQLSAKLRDGLGANIVNRGTSHFDTDAGRKQRRPNWGKRIGSSTSN
jgi:hypothetical protein